MTLQSTAQALYVIDPMSPASQLPAHDEHSLSAEIPLEVTEPVDVDIVVEELPGAPPGTKDPEIEVAEESLEVSDQEQAKDSKKEEGDGKETKWNWSKHGPKGFVTWIRERLAAVPKHSGYDSAGLERAMSYMEKLDNEISRAMRTDLDGELDANQVEKVRAELDEGLSRLQGRLDKVKDSKKSKKKRKKTAQEMQESLNQVLKHYTQEDVQMWVDDTTVPGEMWDGDKVLRQLANDGEEPGFETELVKQAQKITGVSGIMVTVPLLISRIARVCINGTVSAGHDIEDLYQKQVKKYNLNDREQAEVRQLLWDMGYAMREDRLYFPSDDLEIWDSDNGDWAANYYDGRGNTRGNFR